MDIYTTKPTQIVNVYGYHPGDMYTDVKEKAVRFSMIPHFFYEFNNNPNVFVIYAGPDNHPHGNLLKRDKEVLRRFLTENTNENTILCFDNLYEGNVVPEITKIHEIIKDIINPKQVYYVSAAYNPKTIYDKFCKDNNISEKINVYGCTSWEYVTKKSTPFSEISYDIKIKDKNYLCFNRITREHRLSLVSLIYHNNLLDKGYYSYFPNNSWGKDNNIDKKAIDNLKKYNISDGTIDIIKNAYSDLQSLMPLKLNINHDQNVNYVDKSDKVYFENSYYSIVTETFYFDKFQWGCVDEEAIFFSEKIYKPILMKHPFIIVSKPNALKALRECGFKTFAPYINEDYDNESNHEKRLLMIVDEVKRLSKFTDNEWIEWQTNIKEIVEYNFKLIMTRPKHDYAIR